ncbi:hypothetical protein ENBRE01_1564 [Enteropsectra breve]|nr:hypothetical protein ENBRE01_1564 [Enteropsectra breve]
MIRGLCISLTHAVSAFMPGESPTLKRRSASRVELSSYDDALAICEFLSYSPKFKKAISKAAVCEESKILKALQKFVQNKGKLSRTRVAEIENVIDSTDTGFESFEFFITEMCCEQDGLAAPFFSFSFETGPQINKSAAPTLLQNHIIDFGYLHQFSTSHHAISIPLITETLATRAATLNFEPRKVKNIHFPESLIFALNDTNRKNALTAYFSISSFVSSRKLQGYRIAAALIKEARPASGTVLKVLKLKHDADSSNLTKEDSKHIMKHGMYLLYERV